MINHSRSISGNLVYTLTPDRLELEGFLSQPEKEREPLVLLFIHGMYENFSMPLFIDPLARQITSNGHHLLTVNTRAQDYFYYYRKWKSKNSFKWVQEGGSYEIFSNCLLDIEGWLNFCENLGKQVVLIGHSHGALKAAYYMAQRSKDTRIRGLILLSPSDDIGGQKQRLVKRYDEALKVAKEMVNAGKEKNLMPEWVYGQPLSAEMYVDMFSTKSDLAMFRYDEPSEGFASFSKIKLPTLAIFGSKDKATINVTSKEALVIIKKALPNIKNFTGKIIEDANHHYLNKEEKLVSIVSKWFNDSA